MRYGRAPPHARVVEDRDLGTSETADMVFVDDDPQPTGLLDAAGDMIWRYRDPIGFRITKDS
jgi:hypothetical protein